MSGPLSTALPNISHVSIPAQSGLEADDALDWLIDVDVFEQAVSHVNWDNLNIGTNDLLGAHKESSGAQNDEINFDIVLAAGTWDIELLHFQVPAGGIFTLYLGATSVGTVDNYAAVNTVNVRTTVTGVTVATTAKYRLKLKMETKNASSTNYSGLLQHIQLRRTA